jgi:phage tail sheath protein FI
MALDYLHGIDAIRIDDGTRPIRTVRSSVIAVAGTAPDADGDAFPEGAWRLIAGSQAEADKLGATGDLPAAVQGIFAQIGTVVLVYRVAEGEDAAATQANVILGIQAMASAQAATGQHPRILIAPGYSSNVAVATELVAMADRLSAFTFIDGPDTDDAAAIAFRGNFGSERAMVVEPWVTVFDTTTAQTVTRPPSAYVAGVQARTDNERGFWWPIDNEPIEGLDGTSRPIGHHLSDTASRANLLNASEVTTIIRDDGFRVWGSRTCSADPIQAFASVVRTADMVVESSIRAHRWALGRPFSQQLMLDVRNSVQDYIDTMAELGALLGGKAWIDADLNGEATLKAGRFFLDFDLEPPAPLERLTFRVGRNGAYYETLVAQAAAAA